MLLAVLRMVIAQPCHKEWRQFRDDYNLHHKNESAPMTVEHLEKSDSVPVTSNSAVADSLGNLLAAIVVDLLACAYVVVVRTPLWAYGASLITACCYRPVDAPENYP
jgi:hypothetical protein